MASMTRRLVTALLLLGSAAHWASSSATPGVTHQEAWLKVAIDGREYRLAARIFRPAGAGPFPLVVINHGIPVKAADARNEKLGFSLASNWFADQGYIVVVALRPGFGSSEGPYLESSGACSDRDYVRDGLQTASIEADIVRAASSLPGVDPGRIIVVGQSAGGFGAIALGDAPPAGVIGIINFAGGRGGDDHEHICSGVDRLTQAAQTFGSENQVPQLWLYSINDHFFPPNVAHKLFEAYRERSKVAVQFVELPPFDDDGHKTLGHAEPSAWESGVLPFLKQLAERGAR